MGVWERLVFEGVGKVCFPERQSGWMKRKRKSALCVFWKEKRMGGWVNELFFGGMDKVHFLRLNDGWMKRKRRSALCVCVFKNEEEKKEKMVGVWFQ